MLCRDSEIFGGCSDDKSRWNAWRHVERPPVTKPFPVFEHIPILLWCGLDSRQWFFVVVDVNQNLPDEHPLKGTLRVTNGRALGSDVVL